MYQDYVEVLAERASGLFGEMSREPVLSCQVCSQSLGHGSMPVAQVIAYQGRDNPAQGHFVLGFDQVDMALELAGALAENLGLDRPEVVNETAIDLLGEYMNTVVGRTISAWDRMGMPVCFGPPSILQQADILPEDGFEHEHYTITIDLASSQVVFHVTFSQTLGQEPARPFIMVVDDSRTLRSAICKRIEEWGYRAIQAEDGQRAVEVYREKRPQVALMDLVMPKMNGLDAMMAIREFDPGAQFVVMTASDRRDELVTATTLGVRDYLIKPVNMVRLKKTLNDLFAQYGCPKGI